MPHLGDSSIQQVLSISETELDEQATTKKKINNGPCPRGAYRLQEQQNQTEKHRHLTRKAMKGKQRIQQRQSGAQKNSNMALRCDGCLGR
jgi:hypothetical protein